MPWGTEVIDDGGIKVWTDSPDIAAATATQSWDGWFSSANPCSTP